MRAVDLVEGVYLGFKLARGHVLHRYVLPAAGILVAMIALYGINQAMIRTPVLIPASVICMLILFGGLLALEAAIGTRKTSAVVRVVEVPTGFALKWINVCFMSPFILLPLAQRVSIQEAFEIAAVFVFGFLVMMVTFGYMAWGVQRLSKTGRRVYNEPAASEIELEPLSTGAQGIRRTTQSSPSQASLPQPGSQPGSSQQAEPGSHPGSHLGSQSGPSRLADSLSLHSGDSFGGQQKQPIHESAISVSSTADLSLAGTTTLDSLAMAEPQPAAPMPRYSMPLPQPAQPTTSPAVEQLDPPPPQKLVVANWVATNFDWIFYSILFVVGVPVYYSPLHYSMPLDLSFVILFYRAAMLVPARYRLVIHPIIVSSASTVLMIYVSGVFNDTTLTSRINDFKTGTNYLTLFNHQRSRPGAGDILSSLLDVCIVSLAMPMYQYRGDLKRHSLVLATTSIVGGAASFFIYPPLCHAVGISPARSLAFIARSATLALALPVVEAVQGSTSLVAVVTILSGIAGVLFGGIIMGKRGLRFREDDFVTRGISLGICSGAIGSVHLMSIDPRASALASLSFFLYGIVLIVLAVIPPAANAVRGWVGLGSL